ncbi:MAG TPA: Rrf2 family transcriptional regulator [Rubricoccaceae bacterium]|nr:Rrf2 family transcriptional regulator [Rubricoccaceae bacterium]
MLLSQRCEYALRTALYVAAAAPGAYIAVREISSALGIPYHFLAKIVQTLTGAGLFQSMRGPTGGVALARPAARITLKDIVLAVDGPAVFRECVLGLPGCGDREPCPLHDQWAPARAEVGRMFGEATLADTAARIQAGGFRLANLAPA